MVVVVVMVVVLLPLRLRLLLLLLLQLLLLVLVLFVLALVLLLGDRLPEPEGEWCRLLAHYEAGSWLGLMRVALCVVLSPKWVGMLRSWGD